MARILLAEDDREIANLERDYLEMSGHEVVIAPDGEQAMKRIGEEKFDLLILDIMMPKKQEGKEYDADDYCIEVGGLKILTKSWKVIRGGEEIHFPNREFELLKYLAMNPNIVFSKEHLFERIWGYDYMSDSATVTVHINRIREKIEEDPKNPKIIETVWGAGYRLNIR